VSPDTLDLFALISIAQEVLPMMPMKIGLVYSIAEPRRQVEVGIRKSVRVLVVR
jgi:hypothetical protein